MSFVTSHPGRGGARHMHALMRNLDSTSESDAYGFCSVISVRGILFRVAEAHPCQSEPAFAAANPG